MKRITEFLGRWPASLTPSRATVQGMILIPLFAGAVWFGIGMVMPDMKASADIRANLLNAGTFSLRVFAALFFVHLVTHPKVWAWDLPNEWRKELQRKVVDGDLGQQIGACAVLAGETLAKLWLLGQLLRALVLWPQGVA